MHIGAGTRRPLLAVALVVGSLALCATPVGAHSDDGGRIEVVSVQPGDAEGRIEITAHVTHADGHALYRGSVRLAGRSEGGVSLLPEQLFATAVDGRYRIVTELPPPDAWDLRLEVDTPAASTELSHDPLRPSYFDRAGDGPPSAAGVDVPWVPIAIGMSAVAVLGWLDRRRRRRAARVALVADVEPAGQTELAAPPPDAASGNAMRNPSLPPADGSSPS